MATYTLPGADLARILAGALELASAERTLPMLAGVRLIVDNGKLVAASTDRYIAGILLVTAEVAEGAADDLYLEAADVKRLIAAAKANKRTPVMLELAADSATLSTIAGNFEAGRGSQNIAPPDVLRLVRDTFARDDKPAVFGDGFSISPEIYGKLTKVAERGEAIHLRTGAHAGKVILWTVENAYGLIMPVRLPTDRGALTLPKWAQR